jgi:hypothetical protein
MSSSALSGTRLIAAAVGFACLPGLALAAAAVDTPRIGSAAVLKGQDTATIDSQPPHAVKSGEEVYSGEHIRTGPNASLTVEFLDNSSFQVGANSEVVINPSQVQPIRGGSVRSVAVNAGGFRSVTALGAANSQLIVATATGAFTSDAPVVVGEVTPLRVAIFPIGGPGTYVYASQSVTVPAGGALIADTGTGRAYAVPSVAANPATTALMADAMGTLGSVAAPMPASASGPIGYVSQPTTAVAGVATSADGYIDAAGGTESKEEIAPETQVAAAQNPPQPPPGPTPGPPPPGPPPNPPPASGVQ